MFGLKPTEFHRVIPVFESIEHSRAIVFAVLEGNSPGRIFTDDLNSPTCAFLFAAGAFYYAAGDINNDFWIQSLPGLVFDVFLPQSPEPEVVLFSFSEAWHQRLLDIFIHWGVSTIYRKMFYFNPLKFQVHQNWRTEIPAGFEIHQVDQQLADRYPAFQPLLDPTTQRFGFCLMNGETVTCECSAVFVSHTEAEIDIHTKESYRQRGFARLTACAFIDECMRRGLTPSWSCWSEREASRKLALKLGFEELPDVPAILWSEDL